MKKVFRVFEGNVEFKRNELNEIEAGCTYARENAGYEVIRDFDDFESAKAETEKYPTIIKEIGGGSLQVIERGVEIVEIDDDGTENFTGADCFSKISIKLIGKGGYDYSYDSFGEYDNYKDAAKRADELLDEDVEVFLSF